MYRRVKSARQGRKILLETLKYYEINHSYNRWLTNYLTNRKQDAPVRKQYRTFRDL